MCIEFILSFGLPSRAVSTWCLRRLARLSPRRRFNLVRLSLDLACTFPDYSYARRSAAQQAPGSSLFSPSPSVEGRSSVEARDRTRPTPRSRARRLVHAFTPSARREQVPQSCSPPGPPNLATLVATFHRHAKFTISTDQRAKLSKPRGAAVQPTPSAARLLVVGLGVEPSARPRSTPSMPISAPSLCALPALLALPALPT